MMEFNFDRLDSQSGFEPAAQIKTSRHPRDRRAMELAEQKQEERELKALLDDWGDYAL